MKATVTRGVVTTKDGDHTPGSGPFEISESAYRAFADKLAVWEEPAQPDIPAAKSTPLPAKPGSAKGATK